MSSISQNGAPNRHTIGQPGDIYINSTNGDRYECVSINRTNVKGKTIIEYEWDKIKTVISSGDGSSAISPTVTITEITGGHRVTIVDANGVNTFDVMDGNDGAPGKDGEDGKDGVSSGVASTNSIGCKIIAHRGYHVNSYQNTIAAFKEAIADGFKYLEIDIRKTLDGMYILSHDDTITLYNSGKAISVSISKSNYSDIKSYTWDAEGQCVLNTLHALFNAMKVYDVVLICDRKSGTNADIVELANLCGVTDRLLLSYSSIGSAISDADLLNKYDNIPLRIVPTDYAKFETLAEKISNPI